MEDQQTKELINRFTTKNGASETALTNLNQAVRNRLPKWYLQLMSVSDGIEGFVSDEAYLVLWSVEEIIPLNESYAVQEFAPGLLLIGSNGGDTGYALDTRIDEMPVVEVPLVGMGLDQAVPLGTSFQGFLRRLGMNAKQ